MHDKKWRIEYYVYFQISATRRPCLVRVGPPSDDSISTPRRASANSLRMAVVRATRTASYGKSRARRPVNSSPSSLPLRLCPPQNSVCFLIVSAMLVIPENKIEFYIWKIVSNYTTVVVVMIVVNISTGT